jgi:hypothetical protein
VRNAFLVCWKRHTPWFTKFEFEKFFHYFTLQVPKEAMYINFIKFARRTQIFYITYIKNYNIIIKLSEYEYSNIIVRSGQNIFSRSGRPLPTQWKREAEVTNQMVTSPSVFHHALDSLFKMIHYSHYWADINSCFSKLRAISNLFS